MQDKKKLIKDHFRKELSELEIEDGLLNKMISKIKLEEGESIESDEFRHITIREDTDGSFSAKSIKYYNLINLSMYDFVGFLLKESTILLTQSVKVKVIMSLLNLIYEFYPKLTYQFNELDAKILLAIYAQKGEAFDTNILQNSYKSEFNEDISIQQLERSFSFFKRLEVIKSVRGTNQYKAKERIIYERN